MLRYKIFCIVLLLSVLHMQGQERVEVITRGDVTPKESFLEKMKGDFLAVPYFTVRTGVGFVMAYSVGQKFLLTGNVSYGESLQKMMFKAGYTFGICDNFSAGPVLGYSRIKWNEDAPTSAFSAGGVAQYDTRDNIAAPSSGILALVKHSNYSDFTAAPYFGTVLQFDAYSGLWEGGVLAFDACCEFMYGQVPWDMLSTVGDSQRMRGYQMWKYRDNNALSMQVELRQRVWGIFGAAMWAGGAVLWGEENSFSFGNALPDAGFGIRMSLARNLSLRFDWGIGKDGQNGLVFGINEAF